MGGLVLTKNKDEENIIGSTFSYDERILLKKKGPRYLIKVFGLAIVLTFVSAFIFPGNDTNLSFFLALISSVLIIKGYDEEINK